MADSATVLVPRDPTPEMVEAGRKAFAQGDPIHVSHARVLWIWMDMLDALDAATQPSKVAETAMKHNEKPTPPLTLTRIARLCESRSRKWHPGGIRDWSISDWAVATAGEMGEVCNAVKKLNRVRDKIANKNDPGRQLSTEAECLAAIGEEIADTILYLIPLALRCGIDVEAEVVSKFNKTSARYDFPERLISVADDNDK